jgi:hypothetical protein
MQLTSYPHETVYKCLLLVGILLPVSITSIPGSAVPLPFPSNLAINSLRSADIVQQSTSCQASKPATHPVDRGSAPVHPHRPSYYYDYG